MILRSVMPVANRAVDVAWRKKNGMSLVDGLDITNCRPVAVFFPGITGAT